MKSQVDFKPENIHILGYIIQNFETFNSFEPRISLLDIKDYKVSPLVDYDLFFEKEIVRVWVDVNVEVILSRKRKLNERPGGNIEIEFFFGLDEFQDWIEEIEGEKFLKDLMELNLASIAYSTARGIFMAKASGTILQRCIFPVRSPQSLIELSPEELEDLLKRKTLSPNP